MRDLSFGEHLECRVYLASVPGLPRSVRVLIMRMRKRQTLEERGRLETSREGRRGVPGRRLVGVARFFF